MTIVLVLLAALANAVALVLLRKASLSEPPAESFTLRQLWTLLHRPVWASGMAAIFVGFALQATALGLGAVSLVQLVLILELSFTLILGAIVLGGSLGIREWAAIATMTAGVGLLLVMLEPRSGNPYSTGLTLWIIAAVATVAVIAVLTKAVLAAAGDGGIGGVFTSWWTYLLIVTVPVGFFLLQGALQAGRLVASQPGITLANPLVAGVWGIAILGEEVRTGGWLAGASLAAALVGAGAVLLSRSSLLEQQQQPA